ncbi:AMMECR1-like protein [Leucoagaricus sp. SymC.cos]|nr:AMMECR1-like protein [Leucoagaricus sp. SymC.cos]
MALVPPNPAAELKDLESETAQDVCIPEHCYHAFDALYCALKYVEPIPPAFPDEKYPLFVTWNTRPSRPGRPPRLRGCIGNFEPMPIRDGIAEYALISAFRDSRFRRIDKSELETLECGISLLTDFEDAQSYLDWTIGVHGIQITFPHPSLISPTFSATYLPEVMPEQGWDKLDAIDSVIQKAGWNGVITEDLRRSIKLRRYKSKKCYVTWDEYWAWRQENEV